VQSGGARKGEYGRAIQIYHQLLASSCCCSCGVLQRLALAVSLELATHVALFDDEDQQVDPLQRYVHYEQAYLLGELDPAFAGFTVWEMRLAINSDASEYELGWGRASLINYRPDIVLSSSEQWRYCYVVHTDVSYNNPDWYVCVSIAVTR
jgi:hypothetical protein